MRICIYTETALPLVGGQEIVVDQLARQFIELGHDVVVLAAQHRGGIVTRDCDLPYCVKRHPRFISTHRFISWYKRYVSQLQQAFPFDVIHCQSVQPTGYVAACCRTLTNVPVVVTSHCGDICPDSSLLKKPRAIDRCRRALARADAVVTISEFADQCLRALGPLPRRVERIINGVECSRFALPVGRSRFLDDRILPGTYFLFLGRVIHRKGVDLAVKALHSAAGRIAKHLVIAGEGTELSSVRLLASTLGIMDRVHFVGRVEGDEKTWLLQNCIATLVPSRYSEGCPLVVLESFAAGRPVIASLTPGLQELVSRGDTGYLVQSDSPESLANAMIDAASAPHVANHLGSSAQCFARLHDWSAVARRYCDLFERLITDLSLMARAA